MGCKICKGCGDERPPLLLTQDQVPSTFRARYAVGDILGKGTYATVRSCICRKDGVKYAVKIVDRRRLNRSTENAFRDEVRIMKMLDCPNIIKCHEFFEEDNYFYLVEEFVDGGELFDRIARKHVYNEKEARDLIKTLLGAIKYCHDRDVVHRDLKLENLLLAHEGDDAPIKLADFGFATFAKEESLTQVCGSLDYIAPEILLHEHYGKPVDMWSVGVIIYMLLGGQPPFTGDTDDEEMEKIKTCNYEFDKEHWWDVSDEAKSLISHLLVHNPAERYTVDEALLHKWLQMTDDELEDRLLQGTLLKVKESLPEELKSSSDKIISISRVQDAYRSYHSSRANSDAGTISEENEYVETVSHLNKYR
jgi:calcium/calmodulin-dependent protein kinase I